MHVAQFQMEITHPNCKLALCEESVLWGPKYFSLDSELLLYEAKLMLHFVF